MTLAPPPVEPIAAPPAPPRGAPWFRDRRRLGLAFVVAAVAAALVLDWVRTHDAARPVAERIRTLTQEREIPTHAADAVEERRAWTMVEALYERRGFRPLWSDGRRPGAQADQLIQSIGEAVQLGLEPESYGYSELSLSLQRHRRFAQIVAPEEPHVLAALDVRLSLACVRFAWHVLHGRVPLTGLDPDWWREPRPQEVEEHIEQAAKHRRVTMALRELRPHHPAYGRLLEALRHYRSIAARGGWEPISPGGELRLGSTGPRVAQLTARLAASGDLGAARRGTSYDELVVRAVAAFQSRCGLKPSGILNAATRAALNVPVEERVRQIELNLERWRWLPEDLGDPCVVINIPDYTLDVVEGGRRALTMRVVVGRSDTPTPVFSARIAYSDLNPSWTIPKSILANEIVPAFERDRHYLARSGMRVLWIADGDTEQIDPRHVRWEDVPRADFEYLVRQDPGPENPLGQIKFMCPNEYDVYLHDTPARGLFAAEERDRSHGCIRLERPVELGDLLLRLSKSDSTRSVAALIARGGPARLRFRKSVPVHVLYWTAWVDESGEVQFRRDLYGLDARLDLALREGRTAAFRLNEEKQIAGP